MIDKLCVLSQAYAETRVFYILISNRETIKYFYTSALFKNNDLKNTKTDICCILKIV